MYQASDFYLDCMMTLGFGKEMRTMGKMCLDAGVESAFTTRLCHGILLNAQVDLYCDDCKQAQVKLKEIEALLKDHLRSEPQKIKTTSEKINRLILPNEDQELLCASPQMTKTVHALPKWLQNLQFIHAELEIALVLKYFTFQGVIWHMENDQEAMHIYFNKVIECINKILKLKDPFEDIFVCLKWMMECYSHLEEYENALGALAIMKKCLDLTEVKTGHVSPYW